MSQENVAVVGAGIIGVAIAFELQRRGLRVTLIDRDAPGRGASYGNMASIAVTEFMPVSRPSVWKQMPGWLLDPEGPIRVRPSYMPKLVPWFMRFLEASRPSRVKALETAGAALCQRAGADFEAMLKTADIPNMLSAEGCLSLYTDDAELKADREHIDMLERFGFRHEVLGGNAIRDLEPSLSTGIKRAVLFPDNRSVADPYKLTVALTQRFQALGGIIESGDAVGFDMGPSGISAIRLKDGRKIIADKTILCAGAYTGSLAKMLGEPIPLETERGYHTQIMAPGISMRHSIIWPARAFMVTPTAGGIRVGGTVEMAGLDAPPDYRRSKITVKRAKEALPGLKVEETTEWMGHRPALPDTIPIISASAKHQGVFYATGHGHLGLTYSATTAQLIADLVTVAAASIDMKPYRVNRF